MRQTETAREEKKKRLINGNNAEYWKSLKTRISIKLTSITGRPHAFTQKIL